MGYKCSLLLIVLTYFSFNVFAQSVPIGQWRMDVSYKQGLSVAQGGSKIYCATQGGLFDYNQQDNSFDIISRINGLSDVGVKTIGFDPATNSLIIAYTDANIDIIQNGVITNIPDIYVQTISGNKAVNSIYVQSPLIYLACGFGIVVMDITKFQTNDTYYIGPNGESLNVLDVCSDGTNLYAATTNGIYAAPLIGSNLSDYNSWTLQAGLPTTAKNNVFNTMTYFNGNVYANYSAKLSTNAWQKDVIYKFNGSTWSPTSIASDNFQKLRTTGTNLVCVGQYAVNTFDANLNQVSNYGGFGWGPNPNDAIVDESGACWIADANFGLIKANTSNNGEVMVPNGPRTNAVYAMNYANGTVWSVPGGLGIWNTDGLSYNTNNTWNTIYGTQTGTQPLNMDSLHDLICVAPDPANATHAFAGSDEHGLLEFNNGQLVQLWNPANTGATGLRNQQNVAGYYKVEVTGAAFDTLGNLWMSNGETNSPIVVKLANGTWQSLNFTGFVNKPITGQLIVAKKSGQIWLLEPSSNVILVYNATAVGGVYPRPSTTNTKVLTTAVGNGALPGIEVNCLAEDKSGEIWIGTDQGVTVISSPSNIFYGGNYDSQQPYVQQNGYTQYLLQAEVVNAIAVDGGNRKWIGSNTSGAYLMSADGTTQLEHFTTANSPLLSNSILSITVNGNTGEVYFGTSKGIVSYRGQATDGGGAFGNVYAFPNPVKHDYSGPIAIAGLVANSDVKITDLAGTLVYHTTALGGQAVWYGKDFNGERVHTGVYLVFCTSPDGSQTKITKLLFIN